MQMMTVRGWLPDATMPAHIKAKRGPVRRFADVHQKFVSAATPRAQQGGDYDIPNEPDCFDQQNWGSCVLNATVGAMAIVLVSEGLPFVMLSRMFLYDLCNIAMGTPGQDGGTFPHLAVERVGSIGICPESMRPYVQASLDTNPDPDDYPPASDNKATAWFNLDDGAAGLDQLEACIRSNHPVIYGSPVSSAIQNYQAGDILTIPDSNDLIGGHSTTFTGVRYIDGKRVWRVRNSWGTQYGDKGHFLMDDAWAAWAQLNDRWAMTRMDPLLF